MNNCYCGHPEERHYERKIERTDRTFTHLNCHHCSCTDYAKSQEPKALEEKELLGHMQEKIDGIDETVQDIWEMLDEAKPQDLEPEKCPECHYQNGDHHARRCSKRRDTQETEEKVLYKCGGFCGGLHGPECKVAKPQEPEEHPEEYIKGCECRKCFRNAMGRLKDFMTKPQDEPKECCDMCYYYDERECESICTRKFTCPCHQESETEEKGRWLGMSLNEVEELYKDAIILPRPKGMSIGESLYHFLEESPTVWFVSDDDFMTAWKVFLKSLEK